MSQFNSTYAITFPPEKDGELHIAVESVRVQYSGKIQAKVSFTVAFDDSKGMEDTITMLRRIGNNLANNPIQRIK